MTPAGWLAAVPSSTPMPTMAVLAAALIGGAAAGAAYFTLLWRGVLATVGGTGSAGALALARLLAATAFFWAMARLGAGCLLAAGLGFLAARALAVRKVRRSNGLRSAP